MFTGFLQTVIYNGMNGSAGLSGWRSLFIFDGIISLPIAVCGFWSITDSPANVGGISQGKDRHIAVSRMEKLGRAKAAGITSSKIKAVASHWLCGCLSCSIYELYLLEEIETKRAE